ncbi:hypothetical protein [Paraflavitalea sp. CAU 1676]|uniref:hypothetical protein n=1 Tax=Paraflavitalea sp. CAU 1676 TaxID=3032598 RepID=UPI0023D9EBF0|nr:hypothetical protein [Paraflavitalea sp. CAU 1676]MDF2191229.1 hypothetical protein [Paraflavitalea sp. CAU 1676]
MKKVSFLGLLALVVVAASSFTALKRVPTDSWFLLSGQPNVSSASFQSSYSGTYNKVAAYDATKRTQTDVQAICLLGSTYVCAVQIDYSKSTPTTSLNGTGNGDFTTGASAFATDIIAIELRN